MATQQAPQPIVAVRAAAQPYGRRMPLIGLVFALVVIALHHGYVLWQHGSNFMLMVLAVVVMPGLGVLALAGLAYPPLFYAIGRYGKQLPAYLKVLAWLIFFAGAACGFYAGQMLYHFL